MKRELVGEQVTVSGPSQAIVALACQAAAGLATGAELVAGDEQELETALASAVADMGHVGIVEARIILVENGLDITLVPQGGEPATTIEYRA